MVAFERRRSFRLDASDARPWLLGIATKLLATDRRAEQRLLETIGRLSGDARQAVTAASSASGSDHDVAAALAKLDPDQRDVLLLHAWGELSYEEIAAALAMPVGTVRSRLSRGRASVRAALAMAPSAVSSTPTERELS